LTPGVVQILGVQGRPLAVPEREIDTVRAVVASSLPAEPWQCLSVGDRVVLERGPLAGLEGVLVESRKNWRFVVSIHILNRAVAVEIDRRWARPK
jgi:transcription antitermination factor NusG